MKRSKIKGYINDLENKNKNFSFDKSIKILDISNAVYIDIIEKYDFKSITNYKNSKYFVETVREPRRYEKDYNANLAIFAGACQSYFEAIMAAGANFASSPERILIDFLDPLVVAQKIATTERYKFITIDDISKELRDGKKGINGIGSNGKLIEKYSKN